MKLVTVEVQTLLGPFARLGAMVGDDILDLNAAYTYWLTEQGDTVPETVAATLMPPDMLRFLSIGNRGLETARTLTQLHLHGEFHHNRGPQGQRLWYTPDDIAQGRVTLCAPLRNPGSLRDCLSFETHVENGAKKRGEAIPEPWFEMPVYYKGNPKTIIGPNAVVPWPHYTKKLDYELEWACVIGKAGQDIPQTQARNHIAGFMIFNDFSARDIQAKEMKCRLGPAKGKDFASAFGPWLVTPDELPADRNLTMRATVNGEVWSEGTTGSAYWPFEALVAHASRGEMLYPGDIIGSGTVGFGCGFETLKWIQPGDVVTLEIEGLGALTNTVGQPETPPAHGLTANYESPNRPQPVQA